MTRSSHTPLTAACLASSIRELARHVHALRSEPTPDAAEIRDLLRRIARLESQCPGNPDNPLRCWLEALRSELERRLVVPDPTSGPSPSLPRYRPVGSYL